MYFREKVACADIGQQTYFIPCAETKKFGVLQQRKSATMTKSNQFPYTTLFALLGALFFLPFLGGVHLFDWDEINFAEIAREMLATGDYLRPQINYEPFWEKPPLFVWMQALSMHVFGVNEYAARFPNAVCGILTLMFLYRIGQRLHNPQFGLIWAGAYLGSVLPFLYFKSGIIDPWFNLFIFAALYQFILFYWQKDGLGLTLKRNKWTYLLLGGFCLGLAILTKGPAAYLIVCLTLGVYWVYKRFRFYVNVSQFLLFSAMALLAAGLWFGVEFIKNGPWFFQEFIRYQIRLFQTEDAGHGGFPGYHFVVLLLGCFPASVFALRALGKLPQSSRPFQEDFRRWMKFLFWVVLILFSLVQSKIVHYSSLAYFPLTYLAALCIQHLIKGEIVFKGWIKKLLWGIAALYFLLINALPILALNIAALKPLFAKDAFAVSNLGAQVNWTGLEVLPAWFLLLVLFLVQKSWKKQALERGFLYLFGGSTVFVFLTLVFFIKRIEGYSQRAVIEFFEAHSQEDCYISTHAYKSYAHLYYAQKRPQSNPKHSDYEWLLRGPVDKPTYFICKIHRAKELSNEPTLEEIGRKNGFVFWKRKN
jgi:4-amino-4-deoxy-L-arabinose transferase-like glycosyltransferase